MTTFTTEDRIIAEKDGSLTVNANAGEVTLVNKDLTDEEILEIGGDCAKNPDRNFQITFARAILKKAQEK